jgi:Peptidase S46
MTKTLVLVFTFICAVNRSFADEGMWLPQLLQTLNEKDMKKMGMKITAADIYSISKASLKDAIVSFGGFCTGELISDKGLILTNHHCGFDAIQNHSSLQKNYIRDGFWSYNNDQELTNPGLYASFIISIEEVTATVLKDVSAGLTEQERQSIIDKNIATYKKTVKKEVSQDIVIRPFFEGNKYYQFITETYTDIRLVGAPPSSIGNFGKDTDNWMWPRHNGDFSLFRIYAGKDNKPAAYSPENVPYKPKRSLNISLDGVKQGDFTMVFGFPGRTSEYLHSAAVQQIMNVSDPVKIGIREKALTVLNSFMRKDEQIKIQYAAKYAGIENAYKKWKGEVLGLRASNAVDKKKELEASFERIVLSQPAMNIGYADLLKKLQQAYTDIEPYALARDYYNEIVSKIELFGLAANANSMVTAFQKDENTYKKAIEAIDEKLNGSFAEYNAAVDEKLFEVLMEVYVKDQPEGNVSPLLKKLLAENGNSFPALAKAIYSQTAFINKDQLKKAITGIGTSGITGVTNDIAAMLYTDIFKTYVTNISPRLNELQANINQLQRRYMQAQMDVFTKKIFYPDANSTLRVTYGNVKGYTARDAVTYDFYTYLDGVMEKYKPGDYEFDLPQKLIDLYNKKDFGPYAVNGHQPVCLIAANHTTGGNSGSPALDAYGNLIGLNFDRVWEGTMSDINYNKDICRNIMVDIRYVLFIIDKFAGAKNIISELKLVSKRKN